MGQTTIRDWIWNTVTGKQHTHTGWLSSSSDTSFKDSPYCENKMGLLLDFYKFGYLKNLAVSQIGHKHFLRHIVRKSKLFISFTRLFTHLTTFYWRLHLHCPRFKAFLGRKKCCTQPNQTLNSVDCDVLPPWEEWTLTYRGVSSADNAWSIMYLGGQDTPLFGSLAKIITT